MTEQNPNSACTAHCLQADTEEGQAACDKLGVEVLPTVQFWRDKKKLWEHRGILHLEQDLGEGNLLPFQLQFSAVLYERALEDFAICSEDEQAFARPRCRSVRGS